MIMQIARIKRNINEKPQRTNARGSGGAGSEEMNMNTKNGVMNNSYLLVDTVKLRENVRTILRELPAGTKLIPVIKDDAYGMGMLGVARTLCAFPEIGCFAVAHISEGAALRREGIRQDILVMAGVLPFQLPAAVQYDLTLSIGQLGIVPQLADICKTQSKTVSVQVKIETGLHRIGVEPGEELSALIGELKAAKEWVKVTGAFSHFAWPSNAEVCEAQYKKLLEGAAQLKAAGIAVPMCHISGSESAELFPQYAMDAVRIGRRLYMDHPTKPTGTVQEVASWRGYITSVKQRHAGDSLAYFGKFRLDKDTVVATVGVGYGDGLNEGLVACHAPVLVHGKKCPLLACCMDQCFVDVTGVDAAPCDEVTFFGYDSEGDLLSSQMLANLVGDNEGCGLTEALASRVARLYE